MKNGYDQFFRNARKAAAGETPAAKPKFRVKPTPRFELTAGQLEEELRRRAGVKARRKRRSFPWGLTLASGLGVLAAGWALLNADLIEKHVKSVEIAWLGSAEAQEAAPVAAARPAPAEATAKVDREPSQADIDHLSKLNDRKRELDAREQEIARQEAELARMKEEIDRRVGELESMRARISEMLAERVKTDEQKVETLVQMYSNMKPPQAARIFESMDEDLAVEILGRMKKKNAADIMNLLKPEKAQVFSEKYAGYKRK